MKYLKVMDSIKSTSDPRGVFRNKRKNKELTK